MIQTNGMELIDNEKHEYKQLSIGIDWKHSIISIVYGGKTICTTSDIEEFSDFLFQTENSLDKLKRKNKKNK